jgi:hypothetical protein
VTDADMTVHSIPPSRLEGYIGYRIPVGTGWATLTRVSPTRAEWLDTRGPGAELRPTKVKMYIVEDGVEKCVGTAYNDTIVAEPLPDTPVEPVSIIIANGITDWTATTPQGRANLMDAVTRVDTARTNHGLSPLRAILPHTGASSDAYVHVEALVENYGEPAAHIMGQVDELLRNGHTVYVIDLADGGPDTAYALLGLPGVAMTPDTLVILPKADRPTDTEAIEAQRRANEGTPLAWTTDDGGLYTGTVAGLANHLHLASLSSSGYVINVYAPHGRGVLVRVAWRTKLLEYNSETMWGTSIVRVILPNGVEVADTWRFDGRA